MAFKDLLLAANSYPDPPPLAVVPEAVAWAELLGAAITALAFEVTLPGAGDVLAHAILRIDDRIAAEQERSRTNAEALLGRFEAVARERGVFGGRVLERCATTLLPGLLTGHARVRDLTLIPIQPGDAAGRWLAESVVFGSGRPTLLLPERDGGALPALGTVVVAWDHSAVAARALADAMPVLAAAGQVRIVTVTGEKALGAPLPPSELVRHLACHGIEAAVEEVAAGGRAVGEALQAYAAQHGAGLLVMGAYGHSRLREIVLGGATRSMLAQAPLPILLSR